MPTERERSEKMGAKNRSPAEEIKSLLSSAASDGEKKQLDEQGIKCKSPTKLTVVLAALYKKAVGGDLSAIKELLCRMEPEERQERGVVLIDDIKNTDK